MNGFLSNERIIMMVQKSGVIITLMFLGGISVGQKLGIGTSDPQAMLHIKGTADISQLVISAYSTQSNSFPLIRLRDHTGEDLLWINTDHYSNTFLGIGAGQDNQVFEDLGINNTFIGNKAGHNNTSGESNTAVGYETLYLNQNGYGNTHMAGPTNGHGNYNTVFGHNAMGTNNGNFNTAVGTWAMPSSSNSSYNLVAGLIAGEYDIGWNNVLIGYASNTFEGAFNDIAIGSYCECSDVSQARFGDIYTTSIGGYANWTNVSDGRFKQNVHENVPGLDFIRQLRPVTYKVDYVALRDFRRLRFSGSVRQNKRQHNSSADAVVHSGFIAQEVETLAISMGFNFSGVDAPQNEQTPYGLRYGQFVVPLVKAVQELDSRITSLKYGNDRKTQLKSQLDLLRNALEQLETN